MAIGQPSPQPKYISPRFSVYIYWIFWEIEFPLVNQGNQSFEIY